MVFEIKNIKNSKVDGFYKRAMNELNSFFSSFLNWKYHAPRLILVPDRKTWDFIEGEKTESWLVGSADSNTIYVLDPKNFEAESCHKYSDETYFSLIKHELVHCFFNILANGQENPLWLNEGLCMFLSGQNKFKKKPGSFKNFLKFYNNSGKEMYSESGFAVELLVRKYGKKKLILLIKELKKFPSKGKFKELFKSIYGFDLSYRNFNSFLKF
jgi:hypothetical protein